ncbi:hypothetical protein [Dictyobacter kobayashii]|uniref:Uncharacterized protein n=1 Tax=Dictyobacter kobayashii TaxID=2014872 RepID=A0A402AHY4_9CHLR|nr:hypothetical protein [Dictyobacter kobayashii]GCE18728.1 hypothetical protein KDK_25280 [Dictyobacter kobayashii]
MNYQHTQTAFYRIVVRGSLDESWSEWFDGLTILVNEQGQTEIAGELPDQAALHGILQKIGSLGLTLLTLQLVEPTPPPINIQPSANE